MRSLITVARDRLAAPRASSVRNAAPPPYVNPNQQLTLPGTWGLGGASAQLRAMGVNETLYAIVDRLSGAVAALPWRLWQPSPTGDEADRKRVLRHAVLDFLAKPNPFMTWRDFIKISQQHRDLVGEMWWVIHWSSGRIRMPIEMWPVRPDRMQPVAGRERFIEGYVYTGPAGERIPLNLDEVVFSKSPNPEDIYRGMGPVQTILNRIDAQRWSAEWNANFFRNDATPGGIIEAPEQIGDEEFQQFRDRWEESHRGAQAAGRVAILEGGWKWVDRSFKVADMQFAEMEGVGVDAIMRAYGISKFALGMVDDVNRATADASSAVFGQWLTVPRADDIRSMLQYGILPKFGAETLEIDYDPQVAVPSDRAADDAERTSKATAFKSYLDAGVDPKDAAMLVGIPPVKVDKPEPAPAPAGPPPGTGPAAPGAPRADDALLRVVMRLLDGPRAAADPYAGAGVPAEAADDAEAALALLTEAMPVLTEEWQAQVTPGQLDELEAQIEEAVAAGDEAALGALVVSAAAGAALLLAAMSAVAGSAAAALALAGGLASVPAINRADLEDVAVATAELLARGLAVEAGAEALRRAGSGASAREVAAGTRLYLAGLAGRTLTERLSAALWSAIRLGRDAVMRVGEMLGTIEAYVAVEVNDKNRCEPCAKIDGTVYDSLSDARQDYPVIGYAHCSGGMRCRGTVVPVWRNREE